MKKQLTDQEKNLLRAIADTPTSAPPSQQDRSVSQPGDEDGEVCYTDREIKFIKERDEAKRELLEYKISIPKPFIVVDRTGAPMRMLSYKDNIVTMDVEADGKCNCEFGGEYCRDNPDCNKYIPQPSQPGEGKPNIDFLSYNAGWEDCMSEHNFQPPLPEQGKEEDVKAKMISVILSNPENINVIAGCLETYAKAALKSRPSEGWSDEDMFQSWYQASINSTYSESAARAIFNQWLSSYKLKTQNKQI